MRQIDPYELANSFRSRRFVLVRKLIEDIIRDKGRCRILDIGGTAEYWNVFGRNLDQAKTEVHLLNLTAVDTNSDWLKSIAGDARSTNFPDNSFDLIHSNSVIEHVGRWSDMAHMAGEVRRLAPRYFLQTPYFWFPIEPHARFPFLHWMPESWRYRILLKRTCGFWERRKDVGEAMIAIQSAILLDRRQMGFLFPDAKIISERFFGLTKSLIAIR